MSELLNQFRAKYPQYEGVPDAQLADGIYNKFYAGKIDRADFDARAMVNGKPDQERGMLETVDSVVRSIASGATGGFADEIAAGLGTGFGYLGDYDKRLAEERARDKAFAKESPITSTVSEIGGAVVSPMMKVAGPFMAGAPGAGLAARMARGAVGGAGLGAIYGAGNAEGDLTDRAKGAGVGAAFGGAIGGVMPPVVDMVSALGRGAYNQIAGRLPFQQPTVARRKVAEALAREGLTPEQAAARVRELGPNAALMDVGGNPQSLARAAATVPGEGKTAITNFLRTRQEGRRGADATLQGGQVSRISNALDDLVPQRYRGSMDELVKSRSQSARPLYEEAFSPRSDKAGKIFAPWDDRLQQFLDDPIVKAGMKKGIRVQQLESLAEGRPFNFQEYAVKGFDEAGDLIIDGTPNLRAMDAAKRGLDEIIEGYRDKTTGRLVLDDMGRAVEKVRKSLVSKLDDITTDVATGRSPYKEARAAFAGPSRLKDALVTGREILGGKFKNADEMINRIKDMTTDELHYMRIGAVQDLRDRIGAVVTRADATKKIMEMKGLEDKIKIAFGDDAMFKTYMNMLQNERTMFDTYGKVLGGSRTGEVLAEQADAQIDPSRVMQGLRRAASSNPLDWIAGGAEAIGGAKDRLMLPQGTARELAKILMGQDVGPLQGAYKAAGINEARRRSLAKMLTAAGASRQGQ